VSLVLWAATLLFVVAAVLYAWLFARRPGGPAHTPRTDTDERRN
jgi:hypothetical protein